MINYQGNLANFKKSQEREIENIKYEWEDKVKKIEKMYIYE